MRRTLRTVVGQIPGLFHGDGTQRTKYSGCVADERRRTCGEVGTINTWMRGKQDDEVFKVYRREHKNASPA